MSNDYHEQIEAENDIVELRRLAHVHVGENSLLRQRLQSLVSELAKARNISEQELFEEEAAAKDRANTGSNKYGKGSRRGARNPRRDNQVPKKKPPIGAEPQTTQAVLELDEADEVCPSCGGELQHRESLDDTSKVITIEHSMIIEIEVTRQGYGCACCEHIETALPHDEQFVPGGIYGMALVVQILIFKYYQSMPLNRQVKFFADHGLAITTQTMWDNTWLATKMLLPVYAELLEEAQAANIAHVDETRWNIRGGKGKAWVWTLATATAVVFMIRKGRDNSVAEELLSKFGGFLMTDGMSAYTTFVNNRNDAIANPELWDSGKPPPAIIRLACWAHARTYWAEAAEHFGDKAKIVIDAIGKLYRIVAAAEEHQLPDKVRRVWVDRALAYIEDIVKGMSVLPGTSLEAAKRYTTNQWDLLTVFAEHREAPLDNNLGELSLRTPVLGRKNFQGTKSARGNTTAEVMYSIIMTCVRLDISPKLYLDAALRAARDGKVLTPSQFKAITG